MGNNNWYGAYPEVESSQDISKGRKGNEIDAKILYVDTVLFKGFSLNKQGAEKLLRVAIDDSSASFRPGQWEAIDALTNRREKLLVVQRTGWGKSSVYFISTRIFRDRGDGPTIVVSPLLALMRNQLTAADRLGVRAETINSTNVSDWNRIKEEVLADHIDALLVSPERLSNEGFVETLLLPVAERIGLLVVDEVHCISDWGHDFRPDYRRIVNVLRQMPPNMPILGTTATANNRVIDDVKSQLGDIEIQRGPLVRKSLSLQTIRMRDQPSRLAWLAKHLPDLPGTGIVYVLTKRDAENVAGWLKSNDIEALAYYSGVKHDDFANSDAYRQHMESLLLNNGIKVLVATTALGMGFDKPDLGFVIHFQAPGSIVAYYQQVGRAGRAIPKAVGVLLSGREDMEIHEYFRENAFPTEDQVKEILEELGRHDGITPRELQAKLNMRQGQFDKVLKWLSVENPAPVLRQGARWYRTPVAYELDGGKIAFLTRQRELEWQEVQAYIECDTCLMDFLRSALDDPELEACGNCANCLGEPVVSLSYEDNMAIDAARFLRQSEMPFSAKVQVDPVAFSIYKFKGNLPKELRASVGRILSQWGDAGWGDMVRQDKHSGSFRPELARAIAEMVMTRWCPEPYPEWVTCVPSFRHPALVPDLARQIADSLGIPFHAAINKVRDNGPQKNQQKPVLSVSQSRWRVRGGGGHVRPGTARG